jgi:hypothetical protein
MGKMDNELGAVAGKVTLKSNADEALSNESLFKGNGNEVLNNDFTCKVILMKH